MKKKPTSSLCISTYNWPEALELCLKSVLMQTMLPTEIIIGDDGSTEETKNLIENFSRNSQVPIKHIWHRDEGFKLAQIRNKSFAAASGDYIIQVDGDVVLHKHFIKDHLNVATSGAFIAGTRSMLTADATQQLLQHKNIHEVSKLEIEKKYNTIRFIPASYVMYQLQKGPSQAKYVLGANMAFWKEDLKKVNGYNEDFTGWGMEDNDLSIRLCNAGVQLHFLKFAAIIYHLHHKVASLDKMDENKQLLQKTINKRESFVPNGLNKYL